MKRHNVILESSIEPKDKNVLWLQGNKLKKFGNTGWEDIIEGDVVTTDRIENGAVTTDKIAADAFDSTLSKSEKIAPADAVGNKITTLDEKVDALALGKFYGYFPDSTSFPADVSIPGYAYVRLDNSYKIWNFNGESWYDSGVSIDENDVIITTDRIADGAVTSEKIATSAFDSTLSVSGKIAPADVVGEKLSELEWKTEFVFKEESKDIPNEIIIEDDKGNNVVMVSESGVAVEGSLTINGKEVVTKEEIAAIEEKMVETEIEESYNLTDEITIEDDKGNNVVTITDEGVDVEGVLNAQDILINGEKISSDSNIDIEAELNTLKHDISPMYDAKIGLFDDTNIINLNYGKGKYIINLYKRTNEDALYSSINSAYLPHARKDFADVRITDENDTVLKQHMLYCGNIEVLQVKELSKLVGRVCYKNDILYCGGKNGGLYKSENGGFSWTKMSSVSEELTGQTMCFMARNSTIFLGHKGKIYRSEYPYTTKTVVLDENTYYNPSTIVATSLAEDELGNIYVGHYQKDRDIIIEKSSDEGKTFSVVYRDNSGKYQHVHALYFDTFKNRLYAGCDGGGGVIYTDDHGATWHDLRSEVIDIPQSTDYGVVYSEEGYRILCGETSIVGGSTLIKTTNDITFVPILNAGKATYCVQKINGVLFTSVLSSANLTNAMILYSEDEGKTWKTLHTTAQHKDGGASDGFRDLSKVTYQGKEYLICISQGKSFPGLIISTENHYAQVIVDVPNEVSELRIDSGYLARKSCKIFNDAEIENDIFYAALNNLKGEYTAGNILYKDGNAHSLIDGGKHLADIYPFIIKKDFKECVVFDKIAPFAEISLNLPQSIHIGFWMKSNNSCTMFNLLETNEYKISIVNRYQLHINGINVSSFNFPILTDTFLRIDINITLTYIEVYVNGNSLGKYTDSFTSIPSGERNYKILNCGNDTGNFAIQDFGISSSLVSESETKYLYDSLLSDNI